MFRFVCLAFIFFVCSLARAQSPADVIRFSAESIGSTDPTAFSDPIRAWVVTEGRTEVAKLQTLGIIAKFSNLDSQFAGNLWLSVGRAEHEHGISDWKIIVSTTENKVIRISLKVTMVGETYPPAPAIDLLAANSLPPETICASFPQGCGKSVVLNDPRVVEFLYATTRSKAVESGRTSYTGERGQPAFGSARVRIPEDHRIGRIELPSAFRLLTVSLYESNSDPEKHFIIQATKELTAEDWNTLIKQKNSDEALVFVHGFNTSFDESLYRMAQIVWDLQYPGLPVLFSWPTRGGVLNYLYDQQSAIGARDAFVAFLRGLHQSGTVKRVHILAHSMGNFLVLEALTALSHDAGTLAATGGVSELIMAAPDVDRDYFNRVSNNIAQVATGLTLYASSADKAMTASRSVAGAVRAGDVPVDGPVIRPGVDTIDVTALGTDMFGLNHGVFSSSRSVINDIGVLISSTPRKAPHLRLRELRRVPELSETPRYWKYSN